MFPDEVLKLHAEHLGHFTALQNVPKVDHTLERALFEGLCKTFTREKVLTVYRESLTDDELASNELNEVYGGKKTHPEIFVNFSKPRAKKILALLHNLLQLFDKKKLCAYIPNIPGEEPQHMLFLYLIQLTVVFVSSHMETKDLATIMSVATSTFLEANMCNPLCAATLLKPMFIPYYKRKSTRFAETVGVHNNGDDCEANLECYKLFAGYELNDKGVDESGNRDDVRWIADDIQERVEGYKIEESATKKLWFVAPQMGDRICMIKDHGLQMMGGQTGEKALKIASYLVSDNIMAYLQCAVFGTISNMLPCHTNNDFTEPVLTAIEGSMSAFAAVIRHQSSKLMTSFSDILDSCLHVTGVGFAGQDKGDALNFGKIFTGSDAKRPDRKPTDCQLGTFASVTLGTMNNTMMNTMLNNALAADPKGSSSDNTVRNLLSTQYKPVAMTRITSTDMYFFARYHHKFNSGEFTEVADVKAMSDPRFVADIHKDKLDLRSKYQLTVSHGALPMCVLTLSVTMRQTTMMVMGFFCAELARVTYAHEKVSNASLSNSIPALSTYRFKHRKDDESTNTFMGSFGELIKLTGQVFTRSNFKTWSNLDNMEWLRSDDKRLPEYIQTSLRVMGGTREKVESIMKEANMSYNRVLFTQGRRKMEFGEFFKNERYVVQAPLMILATLRVFTTNLGTSFGSVKLSRRGCYYPVKVFSNASVNKDMYYNQFNKDLECLTNTTKSTIAEMLERINDEVSCVLPKIEASRVKMLAPDLNKDEFELLISEVKNKGIEVIGRADFREADDEPNTHAGEKRAAEEANPRDSSHEKKIKLDARKSSSVDEYLPRDKTDRGSGVNQLTIFDEEGDLDFGFDD